VCTEYLTKEAAVDALNRWASDPIPPEPLRKPDYPGIPKSTSVSSRKWRIGAAQQSFPFLS
jgi:hypothetical protein